MNNKTYQSNPILDRLPDHLRQYILDQNYDHYTPVDQAVWRYVMRKNKSYLPQVAHQSYLSGCEQTGINTERIPSMYGMNRILQDIGWAAVAVDGLIPSAAFMEFQAYNVLVIASDIRLLENIEYTPTPDILHEAAGHAPIIANPDYAEYLRRFGELGAKAISSAYDNTLFQQVRKLALLKEKKETPKSDIDKTEQTIQNLIANEPPPSELQLLKNLHWWTIEYGLIGTVDAPKIYGAGLLSSIGESEWCLSDQVEKRPYSIDAAHQSFDVTKPQPQLFVTPDFAYLSEVLEEFANTMSVRKGGTSGVQKLINSKQLGTIELSTGLQISGVFDDMISTSEGKVAYVSTKGPTALSYREKELIGHSTLEHPHGYGTALGRLKGINLAIEDMSPRDLKAYEITEDRTIQLDFEGDITIKGHVITGTRNIHGKIMLIAMRDCHVLHEGRELFTPEDGIYHLAIGKKVVSAYAGPADLSSFDLITHETTDVSPQPVVSDEDQLRYRLYQRIRDIREERVEHNEIPTIAQEIFEKLQDEWLLLLELAEISQNLYPEIHVRAEKYLNQICLKRPQIKHLIESGLELITGEQKELA